MWGKRYPVAENVGCVAWQMRKENGRVVDSRGVGTDLVGRGPTTGRIPVTSSWELENRMNGSTNRVWHRTSDRRLGLSRLLAQALELLEKAATTHVRRARLERDIGHLLNANSVAIKEIPAPSHVVAVRESPGVVTAELPGLTNPRMAIEVRALARELDSWARQRLGDVACIASLVLSSGPEGRRLHDTQSDRSSNAAQPTGHELVGTSPHMTRLRHEIIRMAGTDFTVLVEGESGSGKELVARLIHEHSNRHAGPFIGVNCAALVETLLEAELFGIEDRTATGVRGRRGKFELASGGTLFLDEVSDLSPGAQAKLLRAIQERTVERVGGHTTRAVNTRIVVATNRSLRELVSAGGFRADLFYRLSGVEIHVPWLFPKHGPVFRKHGVCRIVLVSHLGSTRLRVGTHQLRADRGVRALAMELVRMLAVVISCAVYACADGVKPTGIVLGPDEIVIGRTRDSSRVRLLTTEQRLLSIELSDLSVQSHAVVGLAPDETLWGLAGTSRGLWTLVGGSTAARLADDGRVEERVALGTPQLGIFGIGDMLLLQPASLAVGEAVLRRVDFDRDEGWPVGSLRTSGFPTRAETLARNLVGCGSTQTRELPCWFNHDQTIDRVTADGDGRLLHLGSHHIGWTELQRDTAPIDQPGPIVDAHIDRGGRVWVLLRRPTSEGPEFALMRYPDTGDPTFTTTVPGRPRLILDAHDRRCVVLVGTGRVITVVAT